MARGAAEIPTPIVLELGGMNPVLADETANISDATKKIAWGATAWGGQWCMSPGYAYVHESVAEGFVAQAHKALVEMYGEDPKTNSDYSHIINPQAVDRLSALIDQAKVIAGVEYERDGRYLAPTIVFPVSWDDKIMADEIPGPILPILTYRTLDEAFERMAATPTPLVGYVHSRDQATTDRFIGQLSFGGGAVNQNNIQLVIESMPFGASVSQGWVTTTAKTASICSPARGRSYLAARRGDRPSVPALGPGQGGGLAPMDGVLILLRTGSLEEAEFFREFRWAMVLLRASARLRNVQKFHQFILIDFTDQRRYGHVWQCAVVLQQWQARIATGVVTILGVILVLLDLVDSDVRRPWSDHSLTEDMVAGLLVVAVTVLVVDQAVRRRQVTEQSRAVAALLVAVLFAEEGPVVIG